MSKIIDIDSEEKYNNHLKHIEYFWKNLYLKYFPCENEREPIEKIVYRIFHEDSKDKPRTILSLWLEEDNVIGGSIVDYYSLIKCAEMIYLVVDENYRNKGIGKTLISNVEDRMKNFGYCHLFIEADNPDMTAEEDTSFDPIKRIQFYKNLGFFILPIHYIMPPLGEGLTFDSHLFLMHKNILSNDNSITFIELENFLYAFYISVGCDELDNVKRMINEYKEKI